MTMACGERPEWDGPLNADTVEVFLACVERAGVDVDKIFKDVIREAARQPMPDEVDVAGLRLPEERDKLTDPRLRWVLEAALLYAWESGVAYAQLVSAGCTGLMCAVEMYRAEVSLDIDTVAREQIDAAMADRVKNGEPPVREPTHADLRRAHDAKRAAWQDESDDDIM